MKKEGSKGSIHGSISGEHRAKLTPAEQEVLHLLTKDFLTAKKISIRRQCSHSLVCRIIRNLKKKGVFSHGSNKVQFSGPTSEPFELLGDGVRLHGEKWRIQILYKDEKYGEILDQSNSFIIDGNTIKLHRDTIMLFSNMSFFASDASGATAKSVDYWNRFLVKLENRLNVILLKPGSQNVKRYQAEYALIHNGLAKVCHKTGDKIQIRCRDDGRIWFMIDNSFNLHEAETKHPKSAELDMQDVVQPFFNDLKENRPPTLSQVMGVLNDMASINKETASGLNAVVSLLKGQNEPKEEKPIGKADYFG